MDLRGIVALRWYSPSRSASAWATAQAAVPLSGKAYLFGALLAVPIVFRNRYPLRVYAVVAVMVTVYYLVARRNISPAPALMVPVYDAAVLGYLIPAIAIPAVYMTIGAVVVQVGSKEGFATLISDFWPQAMLLALAVVLGELVRSRRALAVETARRLRLAEEERTAEAARLVAEERLRIARELHDTVAHSMATITVQAGSALHLLDDSYPPSLQSALAAIRETSKSALAETRSVLGQLRGAAPVVAGGYAATGLDRLPALRDAVSAAGAKVTVQVEGAPVTLPAEADHAAYRILQESLTNVLRHAGPGAAATVRLHYAANAVTITVTDDGTGADGSDTADSGGADGSDTADSGGADGSDTAGSGGADGLDTAGSGGADAGGHGIQGMAERAASVGGSLRAGPVPSGGFVVTATLPVALLPVEGAS